MRKHRKLKVVLSLMLIASLVVYSSGFAFASSTPVASETPYTFCGFCETANENTRTANGWYWTKNTLNVYYEALSIQQQDAVDDALAIWSNVSYGGYSVSFTFNTNCERDDADILIINGDLDNAVGTTFYNENAAICPPPSTPPASGEIYGAKILISDSKTFSYGTAAANTLDYASVIAHELGHALGIAHCHEKEDENPPAGYTPHLCTYNCVSNVMHRDLPKATIRTTLQTYDKASLMVVYCINHPFSP